MIIEYDFKEMTIEKLMDIKLGCSGWDYRDWEYSFYSGKDKSKLSAYSEVFRTAEINSAFYSYPSEELIYDWMKDTPPDFKFSVKLNRLITHEKQLNLVKNVKTDILRFCALIKPMQDAGKLSCILIQLPPAMEFEARMLEEFLGILPEGFRYALEFRNKTWVNRGIEARKILRQFNVASVMVDEPLLPVETELTADFAYIRWHGKGKRIWYNYRYSREELSAWEKRIEKISKEVEVFGYFNNHYQGYAPENCIEILEMLGIATLQQIEAKTRMEKAGQKSFKMITFDEFTEAEAVEMLLLNCMDTIRFEKAKQIKDIEFTDSGRNIIADVRGYSIYIDTENKFVLHDCQDWKRTMREKKFCKHIGGLILALPLERAKEILRHAKNGKFECRSYTG
jgi:uncharacterized protein YecE (DUF72 family)